MVPTEFKGRNALIIGAGTKLGLNISEHLVNAGAKVVGIDKMFTEDSIFYNPSVPSAFSIVADIGMAEPSDIFFQIKQKLHDIPDLVIVCASQPSTNSFLTTSHTDVRRSLQVNIMFPQELTSLIANALIENNRRGSFVFILSLHTSHVRGTPTYSGSKAYLKMMVKEAAYELASHNIRVNAVSPGVITTEGVSGDNIPIKRTVEMNEISDIVLMLLDDERTGSVTGADWVIDGGLSLVNWITQEAEIKGVLPPDKFK